MPSQKSGGQVLTAPQHAVPEAHQNFSWHFRNLCQDQEMLPTVDLEAIIRQNTSLIAVKHPGWREPLTLPSGWTS